jgi:hypothetical protein
MRSWQTQDAPTNANLGYLENLAHLWPGITLDQYMDKLRGVIGVERMLPAAVKRHFNLPFLFIGDSAYRWDQPRLLEEATKLCAAIEAGLAAVHADPSLKRDGDADLKDRPPTRGEEIAAALEAYQAYPGSSQLSDLRLACSVGGLHRYIDQLDKWLARKRPSSPDRSIAYEIASVLGDLRRRACDYHHEPASYRFTDARTRATRR